MSRWLKCQLFTNLSQGPLFLLGVGRISRVGQKIRYRVTDNIFSLKACIYPWNDHALATRTLNKQMPTTKQYFSKKKIQLSLNSIHDSPIKRADKQEKGGCMFDQKIQKETHCYGSGRKNPVQSVQDFRHKHHDPARYNVNYRRHIRCG